MILSDRDIRKAIQHGRIGLDPFNDDDIQPSSIDLHVDRYFRTFHNHRHPFIDVKQPMEDLTELVEVAEGEAFILHPGEFVLGSTAEYVRLPTDLVARLEGKSSLGRLGLLIHSSLPGDQVVLFLHRGELGLRRIDEIVTQRLEGCVVAFDPETFEVGFHEVTDRLQSRPDRIFAVTLRSGRRVELTGGHDLFARGDGGRLVKVPIHSVAVGTKVAVPARIPAVPSPAPVTAAAGSLFGRANEPLAGGAAVDAAVRRRSGGDVSWDAVVEVGDTGRIEPVYDLEVRPNGRRIENFVAGYGGIFVSNTAGYVDPGFEGHLTLELSNVANLPITIYPGMKIGQISFFKLTSEASNPYGSKAVGSKYQGQRGPTPSRFHENFKD